MSGIIAVFFVKIRESIHKTFIIQYNVVKCVYTYY